MRRLLFSWHCAASHHLSTNQTRGQLNSTHLIGWNLRMRRTIAGVGWLIIWVLRRRDRRDWELQWLNVAVNDAVDRLHELLLLVFDVDKIGLVWLFVCYRLWVVSCTLYKIWWCYWCWWFVFSVVLFGSVVIWTSCPTDNGVKQQRSYIWESFMWMEGN